MKHGETISSADFRRIYCKEPTKLPVKAKGGSELLVIAKSKRLDQSQSVIFDIDPVAKPRMTRRDKWSKRPATEKYWAFKDALNSQADAIGFVLPDSFTVKFVVSMPMSWSKSKRSAQDGQPHRAKPDWDNFAKALCDCLRDEDSGIHSVSVTKVWGVRGYIEISGL